MTKYYNLYFKGKHIGLVCGKGNDEVDCFDHALEQSINDIILEDEEKGKFHYASREKNVTQ